MDGPSHYREAERLLEYANLDGLHFEDPLTIAAAQVHATLANAAATALATTAEHFELDADAEAWDKAAGVPPERPS